MGDDITIGVTEIVNNIEVTAQPNDQIVDISVTDNADNVTLNITPTVVEVNINKGSSFAQWGDLYGTLSDQTDLQNALNLKANLVGGKVPASELPSYVDDIIEVANYAALPATGEIGKIYVTLDNNKIYRWSGSVYIEIASNSAIWGAITGTLSSQTDLVNALNLRVPYTGATSNVNLGEYGLTSGFLGLDTTPTSTPTGIGTIYWDAANRTAALIDGDGDTTLQIGQEQRILVHNNTGSTLTDGQVVYVTGSTGNVPSVSLANASSETTSAATIGVVTESIAQGANGFITTSGIVNGLNTNSFNEGDLLWLGTTAGTFTATKPISPNHLVLIGYVIKKAGGNGSILVKIQNTQELEESSDVLFTSLANNQVLTYESATDLWKNKSIATILGYTPANDGSVVHLAGNETITGNKTFTTEVRTTFQNGDAAQITFKNTGDLTKTLNIGHGSNGNIFSSTGLDFRVGGLSSSALLILANENATFKENLTAKSFIKSGGTSSQFLKADGSVDSTTYQTALTNPVTGTGTTNYIPKFTGASAIGNSLIYDNGTNVGIGTTSPSVKLHVIGASESLRLGTTTSINYFTFFNSTGTQLGDIGYDGRDTNILSIWNNSNGGVLFGANGAERMRITSGGHLLVGTTTSLYGNSTRGNIELNGSASSLLALKINDTIGCYLYTSNVNSELYSTLPLTFAVNGSERMRITSGGNVGIGTTSPTNFVGYTTLAIDNTAGSFTEYRQGGTNTFRVGSNESNGGFLFTQGSTPIRFGTIDTERMRITSGGNVGIRTTSPESGWNVDIAGIVAMGSTAGNGRLYISCANTTNGITYIQARNLSVGTPMSYLASSHTFDTNVTAPGFFNSSDIRLKEIVDYNYNVLDIKPITYLWKDGRDNKKHVGYSAQEVQKVMPDAVNEGTDGFLSVNYVEVLVAKIAELENRIKQLEK